MKSRENGLNFFNDFKFCDAFQNIVEWHSRGQRFDPAYLHHRDTEKPVFARKQVFFYAKIGRVALQEKHC
jgi:hypothetical protein